MAAHWGTFNKPWNYREVLSTLERIMRDYGLRIDEVANDGDYIVIGDRGNLVVQSTGVPQSNGSTWVAITAFSSDSAEAERARNEIRAKIVALVHID